jgi:hypothetical protein
MLRESPRPNIFESPVFPGHQPSLTTALKLAHRPSVSHSCDPTIDSVMTNDICVF